ncbi:MAG: hypothetical protein AB1505_24610 [Candidatus Latescibacterota bacterium]
MQRSKILFMDWRDIQCGHLQWRTAQGQRLGVGNPPEPPQPLSAEAVRVPHGVRLQSQRAQTTGPVDGWKGWGRIIHDGGQYRSWHFEVHGHTKFGSGAAAHRTPYEEVYVCGVASDDGFAWRQVSRSRIRLGSQRGFDGASFFIDPVAPPAERYKVVYCAGFPEGSHDEEVRVYLERPPHHRDGRLSWTRRSGMFTATSPDGEEWTSVNEPFMLHASDTDTTVLWDAALQRYVMYTRMMREDRRWIGRAETADFRDWGPVLPMLWPSLDEPPDRDLYLNGHTHYPGMPEYRLLFPMVYHRFTERSDVRLCSSSDGIAWNWVPGEPVIVPGPQGAWDSEFLGSGKDLVPFGPGRIATPYSGTAYPHKFPRWQAVWDAWNLGWASWPEDRLCGLVADDVGEAWTQPVELAGPRLRLNCRVPMGGQIRVGLVDVEGRSARECDPIVGVDGVRTVTWGGTAETGLPEGRSLALHLQLRRAEAFSVSFGT